MGKQQEVSRSSSLAVPADGGAPDEELVVLAARGDTDALDQLIGRYKNLVRARARTYFLAGADSEDIVQEGMIGLFKAVKDFDPSRQVAFRAFAELCVTRQIMTAVKSATRSKHQPLNTYISLSRPVYEDESEKALIDVISEESAVNPEEIVLMNEHAAFMEAAITSALSSFEYRVLSLYLEGFPYSQIASAMGTHSKSVDNALQRIKRKLSKAMQKDGGGTEPV